MFGREKTLFKLFGFSVKVNSSWLILGFLITYSLARGLFPSQYGGYRPSVYWAMGVAGAIGLFFSIVFHELSHSLIARRFDLPISGITLFIFGGVAEMNEEPATPKAEFFMAVAGPISSIILAGLLLGASFIGQSLSWPKPVTGVAQYLGFLNLILAGFNLIPAFPLDGGRVLRSVLWGLKNDLRWATGIASRIGGGFGLIIITLGAVNFFMGNVLGGVWLFLIGLFLRAASQSSYQQMVMRKSLEGEPVRKFMVADPVSVAPSLSLEDLVEDYIYRYHFKMFPVVDEGRLVGCVTLNQVKEVPREERGRQKVRDLAKGCSEENSIGPDEDVMKALTLLKRTNKSRLMVVDAGRLVGIISLKDILGFLSLKVDLEG